MEPMVKKVLIIEVNTGAQKAFNLVSHPDAPPFSITFVSSVKKARTILNNNDFQVVVSDYQLPDGICTDLLPLPGGIPLIAMIDPGAEEAALNALHAGAVDYVIKDDRNQFLILLPEIINRSYDQNKQHHELLRYRTQLENIVEERTIDLIEMYGKLQENETNFRNIFNSSSDGMIITDYDYHFIEANNALLNQFKVSKDSLSILELMDFLVPSYRNQVAGIRERLLSGLPSGNIDIEVISPVDGKILPYEFSSVPIVFNQKNAILTIMRDVAERKNHARMLLEAIIQTEEEERTRIARDLHDEIGPLISALKMYTTSYIESNRKEKKDKLAAQIGSILREVIDSIKIISNDMSPHVLVNFGLNAALQSFINLFSRSIEISLSTNLDGVRFPSTIESLIYRIIKELLNNTVKHAKAAHIYIHLHYSDSILVCNYRDDGIGFDWSQHGIAPSGGMGINNIITRIRSLGGDFEIRSEPDIGFEINFVLKTTPKNAIDR